MFYIDQPHAPTFPIGLVNSEIKSIGKAGLGRWMLVVAVISVDAHFFVAFSDLTYHFEDTLQFMIIFSTWEAI